MPTDNNLLNTNVAQSDNAETQSKIRSQLASWETLSTYKSHVLFQFGSELKAILDDAAYDEMYGVKLVAPEEGYDSSIRANGTFLTSTMLTRSPPDQQHLTPRSSSYRNSSAPTKANSLKQKHSCLPL